VWDGTELCEQRDNIGGTVIKRFFGGGEQISGTNYYFTRDHLGSIREMVNSAGVIQYRANYDPYGRLMTVQGTLIPDFLYAGMYYETADGLNLTLFRPYDADLGRWLSRDPMGEMAGLNLYPYVSNDPIDSVDSLGLFQGTKTISVDGVGVIITAGNNSGQKNVGVYVGVGVGGTSSFDPRDSGTHASGFDPGVAATGDIGKGYGGSFNYSPNDGPSAGISHPINKGPLTIGLDTDGKGSVTMDTGKGGAVGAGGTYYGKPPPDAGHSVATTVWTWQCGSKTVITNQPGAPGLGWKLIDIHQTTNLVL
jgi:RHS repeat-associated protein